MSTLSVGELCNLLELYLNKVTHFDNLTSNMEERNMASAGLQAVMREHDNHLCVLSNHMRTKDMMKLVDKPKFICERCGRAANKAENLCRPAPL